MKNFSLFLMLLLFFACAKDEDPVIVVSNPNCTNCINFNNPAVGQQSVYIGFEGESYAASNPAMSYTDDTLVASIVEENSDGFLIEEYKKSDPNNKKSFYLKVESDSVSIIIVDDFSFLISNHQSLKLVKGESNGAKAEPNGWEIGMECNSITISQCYGFVEDFEKGNQSIDRLNVYKNYSPMVRDGNGYFVIYNDSLGIVRAVDVSAWFATGGGWDLLFDQ